MIYGNQHAFHDWLNKEFSSDTTGTCNWRYRYSWGRYFHYSHCSLTVAEVKHFVQGRFNFCQIYYVLINYHFFVLEESWDKVQNKNPRSAMIQTGRPFNLEWSLWPRAVSILPKPEVSLSSTMQRLQHSSMARKETAATKFFFQFIACSLSIPKES